MSTSKKIKWDEQGKRFYETGTSKGVLFPQSSAGTYGVGVPWNGLSSVKQSPDGAEETSVYANDKKYLSLTSAENFKGTIEAYTYPDEFMACDGSKEAVSGLHLGQQNRTPFGLVYSTVIGNDTDGISHGEKMHFIYNAKVAPSERSYETINENPNALLFSWGFSTVPVDVTTDGFLPTAYVVIDSTKIDAAKLAAIKKIVYGDEEVDPSLPTIDTLITMATGE